MKRAAFLAACALLCAPSAYAQSCMPLKAVVDTISGPQYKETPAFVGMIKAGDLMLPLMGFANSETGTFTIFLRRGDQACPLADGVDFQLLEKTDPPTPGQGT